MTTKKCVICEKEFTRKGTRGMKALYCSLGCKYKAQKFFPSPRKGIFTGTFIPCEVCGKTFYKYPKDPKTRRFCSMECRSKGNYITETSGEKHWNWKGGISKIGDYLYKRVPGHPNGHKQSGSVAVHRLEMEKKLGRYLDKNEEIHHINGIKTDNRIENLSIKIKKMHFGEVRCPYCLKNFKVK